MWEKREECRELGPEGREEDRGHLRGLSLWLMLCPCVTDLNALREEKRERVRVLVILILEGDS